MLLIKISRKCHKNFSRLFLLLDKSSLKLMVDNTRVQEFSQVLHKDCILLYEQRMTKVCCLYVML